MDFCTVFQLVPRQIRHHFPQTFVVKIRLETNFVDIIAKANETNTSQNQVVQRFPRRLSSHHCPIITTDHLCS